jgi:hypothetical protein
MHQVVGVAVGKESALFKLFFVLSCLTILWSLTNSAKPNTNIYALLCLLFIGLSVFTYSGRRRLLKPSKPLIVFYALLILCFVEGLRHSDPLASATQNLVIDGIIIVVVWKVGSLIYSKVRS